MLFYHIRIKKCSAEDLLVNQRKAQAPDAARAESAASLAEVPEETPEDGAETPERPAEPEREEDEPHGGED